MVLELDGKIKSSLNFIQTTNTYNNLICWICQDYNFLMVIFDKIRRDHVVIFGDDEAFDWLYLLDFEKPKRTLILWLIRLILSFSSFVFFSVFTVFFVICSRAILAYFVTAFGGANHPLYPKDPKKRARIDSILNVDFGMLYKNVSEWVVNAFSLFITVTPWIFAQGCEFDFVCGHSSFSILLIGSLL